MWVVKLFFEVFSYVWKKIIMLEIALINIMKLIYPQFENQRIKLVKDIFLFLQRKRLICVICYIVWWLHKHDKAWLNKMLLFYVCRFAFYLRRKQGVFWAVNLYRLKFWIIESTCWHSINTSMHFKDLIAHLDNEPMEPMEVSHVWFKLLTDIKNHWIMLFF